MPGAWGVRLYLVSPSYSSSSMFVVKNNNLLSPPYISTLSIHVHRHFGRLDFSYEATSRPHKYRIQIYRPGVHQLQHLPRTVTFNQYDQRYDLLSPELLKVHAIVARIFHASGAAEHIEKALHDLGEHCVLAKDGSTDISSMPPATTLGVLGSRAGNVQQTRAAFPDSKTSAQSIQNNSD